MDRKEVLDFNKFVDEWEGTHPLQEVFEPPKESLEEYLNRKRKEGKSSVTIIKKPPTSDM
jgi:hypothetical protein